jgi:hypothetical protein
MDSVSNSSYHRNTVSAALTPFFFFFLRPSDIYLEPTLSFIYSLSLMNLLAHSLTHSLTHLYAPTHPPTHSRSFSLTHIHTLAHSITQSFNHSITHSFILAFLRCIQSHTRSHHSYLFSQPLVIRSFSCSLIQVVFVVPDESGPHLIFLSFLLSKLSLNFLSILAF